MTHKKNRPALTWTFIGLLAATAVLGGCASVETRPTAATNASNPLIAQAGHLAREHAGLSGAARSDNEQQINRLLGQLDDATLSREAAALPVGDPLYNFMGKVMMQRGLPLPRPFDRSSDWNFNAGQRPPAEADGYRPPMKLAVLLPATGASAVPGASVRDGLSTAYYGESRRRPDILFYDTGSNAAGAVAAYDKAVADGNDFVIGPLGRDEVSAVFAKGTLPVPVLALNRGNVAPPSGNVSFSLTPEDEGIAAADYLLERGAKRVLAIGGSDDGQRRAIAALKERLAERGAQISDTIGEGTADLGPFVAKPGGVDAVFLAVKGSAARTLIPKLAIVGLSDKPRVATSQLLSGTGKPEQDRVLDGLAFPSESWTSGGIRGLPPAVGVAQTLPTARGPGAARLFAFGYDAWQLSAYLERLATRPDAFINGATGVLRIDGGGSVLRTPAWSTFSSGVPVPLADAARR
ncbi:LppC putative lipoprotein [Lysobacter capsici AZ78]|uniref:LppC putative lipoprotein n=1 Tax=Lysobacter capsici AZ78 TaxID=1444315 RepID=A0A108UCP4_9GAMM|nr:penicillin-binding protein activator [Lysobacter capsici]KWS06685.1 LppC putative lipoprotein [Lysobacter capsici AZ78]